MTVGKTIQIFLPDGNPRSVKIAEITSRTVQAILIPRNQLEFIFTRNELTNVGVYFLIGNPEEELKPHLYIGEAEDCKKRLKQHHSGKDFWNYAIVVISKTQYFTKTHIKFLESFMYKEAEKTGRYKLINETIPTMPFTSESMEADLYDNFETIKILVSTLGFPIFDELKTTHNKVVFFCKGKEANASGQFTDEGFMVVCKSTANKEETPTIGKWASNLRSKLVAEKVLVDSGKLLSFETDYIFASPSAAAAVVLGRSANGWTEWKNKNGKTIDELIRKNENKTEK